MTLSLYTILCVILIPISYCLSKIYQIGKNLQKIQSHQEIDTSRQEERFQSMENDIQKLKKNPKKKVIDVIDVNVNHLLHELCGDTPEETINTLISVFCCCISEAVSYKITVDEMYRQDAHEFIHRAFGASIRSQQIAQEEMLEMVV